MVINPIKQGDIIGVMTMGGLEAICKVTDTTEKEIIVSDFRVIVIKNDGSVSLVQALSTAKKDSPLRMQRTSLAFIFEPNPDIAEEYKQILSGIVLPNKGIILNG